MEEHIAQLIYDYIKHKKNIDFFINDTIKMIIEYLHLEEYIKDIKPLIHKTALARYNIATKTLYINYQKIFVYSQNIMKIDFPNSNPSLSSKYIILTQILMHEIKHVLQHKQTIEQKSAESIILHEDLNVVNYIISEVEAGNISILKGFYKVFERKKIYNKLYEYSPSERLAEIDSAKTAFTIAEKLRDEATSILMLLKYYESHLSGYNVGIEQSKSNEPTKFYLDSINGNPRWEEIVALSKNLSQIHRIRLGLKANPNELQKIASKCHTLSLILNKHKTGF